MRDLHTHKRSKSEASAPVLSRQIETFRLSLKLTQWGLRTGKASCP
jgi:hypothetical protein